jgi:hypothetical protein
MQTSFLRLSVSRSGERDRSGERLEHPWVDSVQVVDL